MATRSQWIEGARPRTLPAALTPVIAATALAVYDDGFVWWKALLALVVSLALQVGVNYANDYSDGIRGTDDERVGPMRLTGSGAAAPGQVKRAAFAALGVAGVAGLVLAATTSWWLVVLGALCMAGAWFYTGGKHPYGYAGLGEVAVFVFFGLVAVMGTYYVQTEHLSWPAWAAAIGIGAMTSAINVTNNLRDIPSDTASGKRTLAVILGDGGTRIFYTWLMVIGSLSLFAIASATTWWVLIALAHLLIATPAIRRVLTGAQGPALIPVLGATGKAELVWAVLVAVPLVLV
ncbi:1,4-dihydroxy-2-naphthoate polyprenyltransferase [Nocardioides sp.]|uniref:1,4-dihydroxy-2-naphthoate polyprenyltransferase n=1 Tax=Nocardioides sp. TaxID=35761 RepID=UPI002617B1FF|nr:1,4-dihydroxy-2-naphthoate polyprenyltransferase [Nocardioides sp.]